MTKKQSFGLTLLAMEQLDLSWEHHWLHVLKDKKIVFSVENPLTLTRHTEMLMEAFDKIVDQFGKGLRYE